MWYFENSFLKNILPVPTKKRPALAVGLLMMCNSACAHLHSKNKTVLVIKKFKERTTLSIIQILENEDPQYLISVTEMIYVNIFLETIDEDPFPYWT